MTLIEILISMVVLVIVSGGIYASLDTGVRTMRSTSVMSTIDLEAHRVLYRIARTMSLAGAETVTPPAPPPVGSSVIGFRRSTGYAGGAMVWGPDMRIEWVPGDADPVNGMDDDGNGLIDDGLVVHTLRPGQPDEQATVWAHGVPALLAGEIENGADDNGNGLIDEAGLSFEVQGSRVILRLTLERRSGDGRTLSRTVQTTVAMMN